MGFCHSNEKPFVILKSFQNSFRLFTQNIPSNLHFKEILINFQESPSLLITNDDSQVEAAIHNPCIITFKKKQSQIDIPDYCIDNTFETVFRRIAQQAQPNLSITPQKKSRMIINTLFRSIIRTILIMDSKKQISNIKNFHINWGLSNDQYSKMITQVKKDLSHLSENRT